MILRRALAILGFALPVFAQYAGPAILSRGEAPAGMSTPQISFRPYIDVSAVYDTGLAGVVAPNSNGPLANTAAAGIELSGGVSGTHSWRHTKVGLDYNGSVRHYNKKTYFDGTDQSLMLSIVQQFTRHITLTMRETAGTFSRSFGLLGLPQTVTYDPASSYVPVTDYFDNRTIYTATQADLTIQRSTRLSFDFGGDGFLVRRRSTALYGVTGATARADAQYRLTRRTTVGVNYTYNHYDFTRVLGGANLHAINGTYAIRINRWLEFTGYAGIMRSSTMFPENVPVDPVITELLGITTGSQNIRNVDYLPSVGGRLSRTFEHGVAYLSGGHTVTPGNGLFLTSAATSFDLGYNYNGLRRWSLGASASYSYANSVANIIGNYRTASATLVASRQLGRSMHAILNVSGRKYDSGTFSGYNRIIYEARLGFGFAPGDVPLRVW